MLYTNIYFIDESHMLEYVVDEQRIQSWAPQYHETFEDALDGLIRVHFGEESEKYLGYSALLIVVPDDAVKAAREQTKGYRIKVIGKKLFAEFRQLMSDLEETWQTFNA